MFPKVQETARNQGTAPRGIIDQLWTLTYHCCRVLQSGLHTLRKLLALFPCGDINLESLEIPPGKETGYYQLPDISQRKIVSARYP